MGLLAAAVGLGIAGLAVGTVGTVGSAIASKKQAEAQAKMAEFNQKVANQEAAARRAAGQFAQQREVKAGKRRSSALQAALGASGAVVSEGTPLDLQAEQAAENELEMLMIGHEAEIGARRAESQAVGFGMESGISRARGRNALTAGFVGAGSSLLSGFGSLALGAAAAKKAKPPTKFEI